MLSIPDDATREIIKWLNPEEKQLLRAVSRKFVPIINYERVDLLKYGAFVGSVEICELEIPRSDSNPQDICEVAAARGHLNVLQWARSRGYPWTKRVFAKAAKYGHLHVLKWAHASGCPPNNKKLCEIATMRGDREILAWAQSVGYSWHSDMCAIAAAEGNLELLKWLRDDAIQPAICPWDIWTCIGAAAWMHMPTLEWAINNGCPCVAEEVISWCPGDIPKNILRLMA